MIADQLRRQADHFIELADIATHFIRKPAEAKSRATARDNDQP